MKEHITKCAGIDTGKHKLDVALDCSAGRLQVANTVEGHTKLSAWLRRHEVRRVGIEASGGYEQAVVSKLRGDGFVVVVFQPAQVRAYAKFHLQRAKNDKIDAALIAACTAATKKIHAPLDPRLVAMADHQTLIDQIVDQITRCKNYRESCRDQEPRRFWEDEIRRFRGLFRQQLKQLVAQIRRHPDLSERLDLIASVDGIALRTAVAILVRLPEIGRLSREQVAALAGLAPYDGDYPELDFRGQGSLPRRATGRRPLWGILRPLVGFVALIAGGPLTGNHASAGIVSTAADQPVIIEPGISEHVFVPNLPEGENQCPPFFEHLVKFRLPHFEFVLVGHGCTGGQRNRRYVVFAECKFGILSVRYRENKTSSPSHIQCDCVAAVSDHDPNSRRRANWMDNIAVEYMNVSAITLHCRLIRNARVMGVLAFLQNFKNVNNQTGASYHDTDIQNPNAVNFAVFGHYVEADRYDNPPNNPKLGKAQFEHFVSLHSAFSLSLTTLSFGFAIGALLGILVGIRIRK